MNKSELIDKVKGLESCIEFMNNHPSKSELISKTEVIDLINQYTGTTENEFDTDKAMESFDHVVNGEHHQRLGKHHVVKGEEIP